MKSLTLVISALGLFTALELQASVCNLNVEQMNAQISQFGSIHTKGCPLNYYGWGVVKVTDIVQTNENSCFARCKYAYYTGSSGRDCTWTAADWGNTLKCSI